MIKRIIESSQLDEQFLFSSCNGRKILSYFYAYGLNYDFCRFYELCYDGVKGFIFHMNSTMIICSQGEFNTEELYDFIEMNMPFRVELSQYLLPKTGRLNQYQRLRRTLFEFSQKWESKANEKLIYSEPKLDDAYEILSEGFPNLIDYSLWLTNTSHRIRKGISKVYTYNNCTTATIIYDIYNTVLVGQVATKISSRGSGHAREFLYWLGNKLYDEGKKAVLYALDVRRSYYQQIGFREVFTEYVLERQDIKKDNQQKGALK